MNPWNVNLWGGTSLNFFSDVQVLGFGIFVVGFLGNFWVMWRKLDATRRDLDLAYRDANHWRNESSRLASALRAEQQGRGVQVRDLDVEPDPPEPGGLSSMFVKSKRD